MSIPSTKSFSMYGKCPVRSENKITPAEYMSAANQSTNFEGELYVSGAL